LYAAFLRTVGVSAAELPKVPDVQGMVSTAIQPVSEKLNSIETSLQAISQTSETVVQWEYLSMYYGQVPDANDNKPVEFVSTDHAEYDNLFSNGCELVDFKCQKENFKGMRNYLEILGKDGWEMIAINNTSTQSYSVELFFKRQLKIAGQ
jgi:hypothetical protein